MIGPFRPARRQLRARLAPPDARVLVALAEEVLVVLDQPGLALPVLQATASDEPPSTGPADPVLATLMPPMSGDPRDAESLRALTEDLLRQERAARLRRFAVALRAVEHSLRREVCVPAGREWEWLATLNDLRWALAGILGIRTTQQALAICARSLPDAGGGGVSIGSSAAGGASARLRRAEIAFAALTWWQGSLLGAVRRSRTRR